MKENTDFSNIVFYILIHTMTVTSDEALLSEDEIRAKPYVKRFSFENGKAVYRINPNDYKSEIKSLVQFKEALAGVFSDLHVTNYEVTRLDFSINTIVEYDKIYKINNYLKELYALHIGVSNSYYTNGADLKKRSLKVTGRDYELEVYNKELQSKGRDPAKSRIEFRFKRLNKNQTINSIIKTVYRALNTLPSHIERLNQLKISQLYDEYIKEKGLDYEGRVKNLPEFVSRYADFVYNTSILNGLYNKIYHGKCKNWLYRYRLNGRTLTLYNKGDLFAYIKLLKTAMRTYAISSTKESLLSKDASWCKTA